jgi:1-acyl-sn-glycerol-3-phosphate acyltransferase
LPWFYYVGRWLVRMLLFLFTRWEVRGKENVPDRGALLIVSNHMNLADPPLLGVCLGRIVIFMAKKELFQFKPFAYFIRSFGAFSVYRGQLDRNAIRQANRLLTQGQALVMFPEGMRSRSGKLRSAFPGSALLALRCNAPILPVGITGTEKIKGVGWILRRPRITVNIGHPFYLPPVSGALTKEKLVENTNIIMQRIATLLPPEYQGYYAGESVV